jgi:hypothetical protein
VGKVKKEARRLTLEATVRLTNREVELLAAWAREEWAPACYSLPAHRLQLDHGVSGAELIALIKAWTEAEGKRDREILEAAGNPQPCWPWSTDVEFRARLERASRSKIAEEK